MSIAFSRIAGGGPAGKMYAQPRERCSCGATVLELYTCRNCGTAYARAYTDQLGDPGFLWADAGVSFRSESGFVAELEPLDILLESPVSPEVERFDYDLVTGRLDPPKLGPRTRQVFLKKNRSRNDGEKPKGSTLKSLPGEFRPCVVCLEQASFGRSSVQDHTSKGDEPFQTLITRQLQIQAPSLKDESAEKKAFVPLQGRKVLIFSDSRQLAARFARRTSRPTLCATRCGRWWSGASGGSSSTRRLRRNSARRIYTRPS